MTGDESQATGFQSNMHTYYGYILCVYIHIYIYVWRFFLGGFWSQHEKSNWT